MMIVNYKDFLDMAMIPDEIPNIDGLYGAQRDSITEKQKTYLHQLGIGTTGLKYKGQASKVIELALMRKNNGLATPGQMRTLQKYGVKNVHCFTYINAKNELSKLDGFMILRKDGKKCTT